ncbi:MAG: AarF/ABC1/UbiB kinase family protein [Chloroflexota bacterium]
MVAPSDPTVAGGLARQTQDAPAGVAGAGRTGVHFSRRQRFWRITWLFVSLTLDLWFSARLARLAGHAYDLRADSRRNRRRAIRFRRVATDMGGVLIKLGQFLSTRVDFLPVEYIEELGSLQDQVPPVPFEAIEATITRDLGGPIEAFFTRFERVPLAAASLGQVHRAALPTGEDVAVKVQRPDIDILVDADLASLRFVIRILGHFGVVRRQVDLDGFYREFATTLVHELDYMREGHYAERFSVNFAGDPNITLPAVYWSLTTRHVLTMEYVYGIKINNYAALDRAGISRKRVSEILVDAYLRQLLEHGFFHADPHPGNLFVRPGPVIVFVDFGMIGDITPRMRVGLRAGYLAVVRRDINGIITALDTLGFIRRGANLDPLRQSLGWIIDRFWGSTLEELQQIDPREFAAELEYLVYENPVQLPSEVAFTMRAVGTLSGLATGLDPSFQLLTVLEPYARRLTRKELSPEMVAREALREARAIGRAAVALPRLSHQTLSMISAGEVKIRQESSELVRSVNRLRRDLRRLGQAMVGLGVVSLGTLLYMRREGRK